MKAKSKVDLINKENPEKSWYEWIQYGKGVKQVVKSEPNYVIRKGEYVEIITNPVYSGMKVVIVSNSKGDRFTMFYDDIDFGKPKFDFKSGRK